MHGIFAVLKAILSVLAVQAGKSVVRIVSGTGANPAEQALSRALIDMSKAYLTMMKRVNDAGLQG